MTEERIVSLPESAFRKQLELAYKQGQVDAAIELKPAFESLTALVHRMASIRDAEGRERWLETNGKKQGQVN